MSGISFTLNKIVSGFKIKGLLWTIQEESNVSQSLVVAGSFMNYILKKNFSNNWNWIKKQKMSVE